MYTAFHLLIFATLLSVASACGCGHAHVVYTTEKFKDKACKDMVSHTSNFEKLGVCVNFRKTSCTDNSIIHSWYSDSNCTELVSATESKIDQCSPGIENTMLTDIRCNTSATVIVTSDGSIRNYTGASMTPIVIAVIFFFICLIELCAMVYLVYGREDSDDDLKIAVAMEGLEMETEVIDDETL